jgi:16S rRNA (cytosine1402-N4)-methyltransferase
VLLNELVQAIEVRNDKQNVIVDTTLGMAWHANKIIEKMNKWDIFVWFDADIKNLELAKERLWVAKNWKTVDNIKKIRNRKGIEIFLINSNFLNIKKELHKIWIQKITWIYYDLGLSSLHIDEAERWFSFMKNWPLDMRFDKSNWRTASDIVNSYDIKRLREIFWKYWEEPQSSKIAKLIVEERKNKKFEKTLELAEIISWWKEIKSRIFQAIRIEVNNELVNLEKSLNDAINLLEKDWIVFVISFHSLEDRIVKNIFRNESKDCICEDLICSCKHNKRLELLNKKPITPTEAEIKQNPRSHSAKARRAKKIDIIF